MRATIANDPDRVIFESPVVMAGEFRCPVGHPRFEDTGPTRQYCFVFPRHACWIEQQGLRPFVADSTIVPLYNLGHPYRRGVISADGDATDWFAASPAVLREMVAVFDPHRAHGTDQLFARPFVAATSATFLAQRCVFEHLHQAAAPDVMFVEESVLEVLANVLEREYAAAPPTAGPTAHRDLAERAREHLARTFRQRDGVSDVATAIGSSAFHLCRVFRRETGLTLHHYRTELRLRWSLEALGDGTDILTVALAAGFSHHSHFTAAFRRSFGILPSAFREIGRDDPRKPL